METIALLQAERPKLHVLIVGSDVVAYGGSRDLMAVVGGHGQRKKFLLILSALIG